MTLPAPLEVHFLAPREVENGFTNGRHHLASVHYGPRPASGSGIQLSVPLALLGSEPLVETWTCDTPPTSSTEHGFEIAATDELLFAATSLPEGDLEAETYDVYCRMLDLVAARGFHLFRVWNVIPELNGAAGTLDRYMSFCLERGKAFEEKLGPNFEPRLCAFSAVGSRIGPQVLYFLASREAGVQHENPRQMSAYRYPARYGPRSPSFARATSAPRRLGGDLFLSGTASIVGHESRHPGDALAQLDETLCNLRVLLGLDAEQGAIDREQLPIAKVFLRHKGDQSAIARRLTEVLGPHSRVMYLEADICRPELLVEIEGVGRPAGRPSERPVPSGETALPRGESST